MDAVNAEGVGGGDGMSPPLYDDAQGGKVKLDYDNLLGAREVTR